MLYFFMKLIPPRPSFASDMSESEAAMMRLHVHYWQTCMAEGRVLAFGPVFDPSGTWGLGILTAEDEAAARACIEADPAIRADFGLRYELFLTDLQISAPTASPRPA